MGSNDQKKKEGNRGRGTKTIKTGGRGALIQIMKSGVLSKGGGNTAREAVEKRFSFA